jgi:hypothetical protein
MADTPIDRAENLTSIRLKVPTGTVPVPPPGHLQLHAPDYDTLAVRRGDGSVVEIGGSSGPTDTLVGSGGIITAAAGNGPVNAGLSLLVGAGLGIYASGPLIGASGALLGAQVATVPISSAELLALDTAPVVLVPAQGAGFVVEPLSLAFRFHPGGVAYSSAASLTLGTPATPDIVQPFGPSATDVLGGGINADRITPFAAPSAPHDGAAVENQPLVLGSNGPITLGNGTLTVTTVYLVL